MAALVAKSYQNLEQLCDPYSMNGKMYVKVRTKSGAAKVVRAYSEAEYRKYNPEVKVIQKPKSQREIFGFGDEGFIWIFKGDTYAALDWFRIQPTRYADYLGWYLSSEIELPTPLPAGVEPVKLYWDKVCDESGEYFKDKDEIKAYVETLIYDAGTSEWIGEIGDRITLPLTCTRIISFMNSYGESTMYNFETDNGDVCIWSTQTSKDIEENHKYMITGTIKKHGTYRNVKQTQLSRCVIKEELGEF
jgi:hypothetical protein